MRNDIKEIKKAIKNKNKDWLKTNDNIRDSQEKKIEKGKEKKSQSKIQNESRTKGNTIKKKEEQYKIKKVRIRKTQKEIETKIKIETKKIYNQNYNKKNNKKREKAEKLKKQKVKKIKNPFKDFKIFYQNVRGLNSKIDKLEEAIDDHKPDLICLVETHLAKEDQIGIPGYRIYRNYGTKNRKGILIPVRNSIKTMAVEISRHDEVGQTLRILLNNLR